MTREYGDFQTPTALVDKILDELRPLDQWIRVLEPTCGTGNFIAGLVPCLSTRAEIVGLEIQSHYVDEAADRFSRLPNVGIRQADVFDFNFARDISWSEEGSMLVIGNLPWVTSAELSTLRSRNLPPKDNPKGLKGLDAKVGGSNFDLAEYIWLKLLRELRLFDPTMALLCKTVVARRVLEFAEATSVPIHDAEIRRIDARSWFGVSVDACLLKVDVREGSQALGQVSVYPAIDASEAETTLGYSNGGLVALGGAAGITSYIGVSPVEWRQGVKHDAAGVMELTKNSSGDWTNKKAETVSIEDDYVFPLAKGRTLFHGEEIDKGVIITQRHPGDDTRVLQERAPALWSYLTEHRRVFESRKSSIYQRAAPFSIFGIGPYSFADYKVAISGLHKEPRFRVLPPVDGKPVMVDDTCYFIPCNTLGEAAMIAAVLNSNLARQLLNVLVFWSDKRPIKKSVLMQVDIRRLVAELDPVAVKEAAEETLENLGEELVAPDADVFVHRDLGPLFAAK